MSGTGDGVRPPAPNGGVVLALLDEAMAWATIALGPAQALDAAGAAVPEAARSFIRS